jgi:AbiV family abortive infection protein
MCFYLTLHDIEIEIELCLKKANTLVNDAEILLNNNGNLSHVVGLYTLAVEEYGKGNLLKDVKSKSLPRSDQKYKIDCSKFLKHKEKLQKANLPEACIQINVSKKVIDNTSNESRTIKISNKLIESIISIPPYTSPYNTLIHRPLIQRW